MTGEPTSVRRGRDQIADAPRWLRESYLLTSHRMGQHLVEREDADGTTGVAYCVANHVWRDEMRGPSTS